MSVIKSKRGESSVQFLETAQEIQKHSLRQVVKYIPKRYTFYVSQKITDSATDAHSYVKKANSIFPTNKRDAELRREFFMRAYAEYQSLISQINIAYDMFHIPDDAMVAWMQMINSELALIKAVMRKDKERYFTLAE